MTKTPATPSAYGNVFHSIQYRYGLHYHYNYHYRLYQRVWRLYLALYERYKVTLSPELMDTMIDVLQCHKDMQAALLRRKEQLYANDPQGLKLMRQQLAVLAGIAEKEQDFMECLTAHGAIDPNGAADMKALKSLVEMQYRNAMLAKVRASAHAHKSKGIPKRDRVNYTKAKAWAAAIRQSHPKHSATQIALIIIKPTDQQKQDYGIDDTYAGIKLDTLRKKINDQ